MGTRATIAKNAFFNWVTAGADVAINFLVSIVLARGLGPEEYGVYSFLMWLLTFLQLVVNMGLGDMARRFIAEALGENNREKARGLAQLSLILRGAGAALGALLLAVLSGFWARVFGLPSYELYFFLLALALLPNVLNTVLTSIFAGYQKYEYGAYLMLGTNPLRAAGVVALLALGYGVRDILLLSMGIWVCGVFLGLFLLRRLVALRQLALPSLLDKAQRYAALKYAFTVALVMSLDYFIWDQAEIFFLGRYRPAAEVGFYNLAAKLPSQVMTLIPLAFGSVLLPAISEQFGRSDFAKIRTIYLTSARYLTIMAVPLVAIGIALAAPLVTILYGSAYMPVAPIMSILFVSFAAMALDKGPIAVMYGTNRPYFALKVGLLLAAMNVALSYWLIPKYGLAGAAIGSSIPRFLSLLFYTSFVSRKVGATWPFKDTMKIVLAGAMMGIAAREIGNRLPPVEGVVLAVPLSLGIYAVILFALKVFRQDDIQALWGIHNSLPRAVQRYFAPIVGAAQRLVSSK